MKKLRTAPSWRKTVTKLRRKCLRRRKYQTRTNQQLSFNWFFHHYQTIYGKILWSYQPSLSVLELTETFTTFVIRLESTIGLNCHRLRHNRSLRQDISFACLPVIRKLQYVIRFYYSSQSFASYTLSLIINYTLLCFARFIIIVYECLWNSWEIDNKKKHSKAMREAMCHAFYNTSIIAGRYTLFRHFPVRRRIIFGHR